MGRWVNRYLEDNRDEWERNKEDRYLVQSLEKYEWKKKTRTEKIKSLKEKINGKEEKISAESLQPPSEYNTWNKWRERNVILNCTEQPRECQGPSEPGPENREDKKTEKPENNE